MAAQPHDPIQEQETQAETPAEPITRDDYLAYDAASEQRAEFIGGDIVDMAGASRRHNLLTTTCVRLLGNQLVSRPCEIYASDMRLRINASDDYVYPDVVVVCGEPKIIDLQGETLTNPTVIFEVLSPTTAANDHGAKWAAYQQIETLGDYVLIEQDRMRVEHYTRQKDGWLYRTFDNTAQTLDLASIGCTLPLSDIYEKITFETASAANENANDDAEAPPSET